MTHPLYRSALAIIALLALVDLACAQTQTIGPGGTPMVPGPSQPRDFTPGGTGAGGAAVAPGRAARGANVERIGPGGTPLAPGPTGSVRPSPTPRPAPTLAPSSRVTTAIYSKRRPVHRSKHRLRRHSPNIM